MPNIMVCEERPDLIAKIGMLWFSPTTDRWAKCTSLLPLTWENIPPTIPSMPSGKYLRDDGTWQTIAGGGDMTRTIYDPDEDGKIAEAQTNLNYPTHSNALDHSDSLDHTQGTDQGLDTGGTNAVTAEQTKTAYTHSQAAHAPSNAQKNSDILKSEIEAVLTGEISSHSHAGGGGGLSQPQVMARSLGC